MAKQEYDKIYYEKNKEALKKREKIKEEALNKYKELYEKRQKRIDDTYS